MGILEDSIETTRDVAQQVVKKTGQITKLAALKIDSSHIENKIEKNFAKIGRSVYEGAEDETFISDTTEEINALYEKLADIKAQIAFLRNKQVCPECGTFNESDSKYCKNCAEEL